MESEVVRVVSMHIHSGGQNGEWRIKCTHSACTAGTLLWSLQTGIKTGQGDGPLRTVLNTEA